MYKICYDRLRDVITPPITPHPPVRLFWGDVGRQCSVRGYTLDSDYFFGAEGSPGLKA